MKYQPPFPDVGQLPDPERSYVNGDPSIAQQGSIPPAEAFEFPQREIVSVITRSFQTPSDQDLEQLTRGARDGKLNFCVDGGPLNQIQVTLAPPFRGYEAGLVLRVLVAHTVTGPTTISINRMNPTAVRRRDGAEMQPNDILAGQIATLLCDGTFFQLQNFGEDAQEPGGPITFNVDVPYVRNSSPIDAGNHFDGMFSPPLDNINEGRTVEVKSDRINTGPMTFRPNEFPTHPICRPDGSPLEAGDIQDNMICWLMFDSEQWQLLTQRRAPIVKRRIGKSLQFVHGPGYGGATSSALFRVPKETSNTQTWTVSVFVRYPTAIEFANVTSQYAIGTLDDGTYAAGSCEFFSAAAGTGGAATGWATAGSAQGNVTQLYWALAEATVSGIGPYQGPAGTFQYGVSAADTKWHHVLLVADGTNLTMNLDGRPISQGSYGGRTGTVNVAGRACALGKIPDFGGLGGWYGTRCRMAEFYLVDGLALDWTVFAENVGGIILPKDYTGNVGLNGCYLNWSDASAVTTTTLGRDYSGNGNNWTPINFNLASVLSDYPGIEN
jgi:hypothetical protein